jgi:predicted transcriptional regulator
MTLDVLPATRARRRKGGRREILSSSQAEIAKYLMSAGQKIGQVAKDLGVYGPTSSRALEKSKDKPFF